MDTNIAVHYFKNISNCDVMEYTLNANLADHLVGTWDELHESEASQALMFCFDNASPEKSCVVIDLVCFYFALPTSCCVPEYHQKEVKSSTAEKDFFFVSAVASVGRTDEGKEFMIAKRTVHVKVSLLHFRPES